MAEFWKLLMERPAWREEMSAHYAAQTTADYEVDSQFFVEEFQRAREKAVSVFAAVGISADMDKILESPFWRKPEEADSVDSLRTYVGKDRYLFENHPALVVRAMAKWQCARIECFLHIHDLKERAAAKLSLVVPADEDGFVVVDGGSQVESAAKPACAEDAATTSEEPQSRIFFGVLVEKDDGSLAVRLTAMEEVAEDGVSEADSVEEGEVVDRTNDAPAIEVGVAGGPGGDGAEPLASSTAEPLVSSTAEPAKDETKEASGAEAGGGEQAVDQDALLNEFFRKQGTSSEFFERSQKSQIFSALKARDEWFMRWLGAYKQLMTAETILTAAAKKWDATNGDTEAKNPFSTILSYFGQKANPQQWNQITPVLSCVRNVIRNDPEFAHGEIQNFMNWRVEMQEIIRIRDTYVGHHQQLVDEYNQRMFPAQKVAKTAAAVAQDKMDEILVRATQFSSYEDMMMRYVRLSDSLRDKYTKQGRFSVFGCFSISPLRGNGRYDSGMEAVMRDSITHLDSETRIDMVRLLELRNDVRRAWAQGMHDFLDENRYVQSNAPAKTEA